MKRVMRPHYFKMTSILDIPLKNLKVSGLNVRKDFANFDSESETSIINLADDIQERGLINPITVRSIGENAYEVVAGQRRFMAFTLLEKETIPCIIKNMSDDEAVITSLSENLQRVEMTQKDKCETFYELYSRLGKDVNKVSKKVNLGVLQIKKYITIKENVSPEIIALMDATGDKKVTVETALLLAKNVAIENQIDVIDKLNKLGSSHDKNLALQEYQKTGCIDLAIGKVLLNIGNMNVCDRPHYPHIFNKKGEAIEIPKNLFSKILQLLGEDI